MNFSLTIIFNDDGISELYNLATLVSTSIKVSGKWIPVFLTI